MTNSRASIILLYLFIFDAYDKELGFDIASAMRLQGIFVVRVELNIRRVQIKAERISANYYLTDVQTWPTLCTRLRR